MIIGNLKQIRENAPGAERLVDKTIRRYEKLIDDIMIASMDNERIGDIIEKELEE